MTDESLKLDLGNIAWAPVNSFITMEPLDRFNGVPTLGVLETKVGSYVFWRVLDHGVASAWLYVNISRRQRSALVKRGDDALDGVLFQLKSDSYATLGLAYDNRLFFEREMRLTAGLSPQDTYQMVVNYALEALQLALEHDLPPGRREKMIAARRELESA